MYEYADGVTELAMKHETHLPRSLSSPENESKGGLRGGRRKVEKEVAKDVHQVVVEVKKEVEVEVEKEAEVEGEVEVKQMVTEGGEKEVEKEGEKEGEKEAVKEGGVSEEPVTGRITSSCHSNVILLSSPFTCTNRTYYTSSTSMYLAVRSYLYLPRILNFLHHNIAEKRIRSDAFRRLPVYFQQRLINIEIEVVQKATSLAVR